MKIFEKIKKIISQHKTELTDEDPLEKFQKELKISVAQQPNVKKIIFYGVLVIVIFFGGFGLWSIFAKIETAAVLPGEIIVAGNDQVVQHLEGGIIRAIYVANGVKVKKGQILFKIDDTQSAAKVESQQQQVLTLLADEARIQALLNNMDHIVFPKRLLMQKNSKEIQKLISNQQANFNAERASSDAALNILQQRVIQLQKQIEGVSAQLVATVKQLHLIEEQLQSMLILAKDQIVDRGQILGLEREKARLQGTKGEYTASIANLKEKIGETQIEILSLKDKLHKNWNENLHDVRQKLAMAIEGEKAAADVYRRTKIVAPIGGTIVDLTVFTVGRVIKPGETLLTIVPQHQDLIVDAKLNIHDIDVVHPGLKAKVSLTAFKTRTTPMLLGTVDYVAADAKTDERNQAQYYVVQVRINKNELKKLSGKKLYPGMPAEVMIVTQELSPFEYFMDPVKRSIQHSFRED